MGVVYFFVILQWLQIFVNIEHKLGVYAPTPPSFIRGPSGVTFVAGARSFELSCWAVGEPSVKYGMSWRKYGQAWSAGNIFFIREGIISNIEYPNGRDQGDYQCVAENEYGIAVSDKAVVRLAYLSRDEGTPREYTPTKGQSLMLPCDAWSSYPAAVVTWKLGYRGSRYHTEIPIDDRTYVSLDGDLVFTDVEPVDDQANRQYFCSVWNSVLERESLGSNASIIVQDVDEVNETDPTIVYASASSMIGVLGGSVDMQCICGGFPSPVHAWYRIDGDMPVGHEVQMSGSILHLSSLQLEDAGEYICSGSNDAGSVTRTTTLVIESAPVFVTNGWPVNQHKTETESVSFLCATEANPRATVQWMINGERIERVAANPRRSISDDGTNLTITDLVWNARNRGMDTMVVQCNASNVHGYVYGQGYINTLEKQLEFTIRPEDVAMEDWGEQVVFNCDAECSPRDTFTIRWEHNGQPIDFSTPEFTFDGRNLLINYFVEAADVGMLAGSYSCIPCIESRCIQATAMLSIDSLRSDFGLSIPHTGMFLTHRAIGSNAVFSCTTTGMHQIIVKWYHPNGDHISAADGRVYVGRDLHGHRSLEIFISNLVESDAGSYRCEASYRGVVASENITVKLDQDITFGDVPESQFFSLSHDVKIICDVRGTPAPHIDFRKNTEILQYGRKYGNEAGGLLVYNVSSGDAGQYECRGSVLATARFDARTISVGVQEMPEPMHTVRFQVVDKTSITLDILPRNNYVFTFTCYWTCGIREFHVGDEAGNWPYYIDAMQPSKTYDINIQTRDIDGNLSTYASFNFPMPP